MRQHNLTGTAAQQTGHVRPTTGVDARAEVQLARLQGSKQPPGRIAPIEHQHIICAQRIERAHQQGPLALFIRPQAYIQELARGHRQQRHGASHHRRAILARPRTESLHVLAPARQAQTGSIGGDHAQSLPAGIEVLGMPAIDPQSIERVQGAGLELAPGLAQGAFGGTAHDMGVAAQRSEEPVQRCLHALVARMLKHEAHQRWSTVDEDSLASKFNFY
ncbi:hypothetical protein MASR1M50_04140 [Burkholderiales bacterium]